MKNTTCSERLMRSVPMNMRPVKTPHAMRYQPMATSSGPSTPIHLGKTMRPTSVSQKRPYDRNAVMPKVLFFFHSMMPAMTCAMPP